MNQVPSVAVRGAATVEADPEIARLVVSVTAEDKDRQRTLARLTERAAAVAAVIEGHGAAIERSETSGVSVRPQYKSFRKPGDRVSGYTGTVTTRLTVVDFTVVGDLVLALGDQEQTTVDGPSWSLRPDSMVHRAARREAAKAAVQQAREYADALGGRLTGLIELADTGLSSVAGTSQAQPVYGRPQVYGGAPELQLDPEIQVVTAQVEARFTMSQPPTLVG